MIILAIAVALFALLQLPAVIPALRRRLKSQLGRAYPPLFGLASLVSLVALAWAWNHAPRTPFYEPPHWGRYAAFATLALASLFLGTFLFRGAFRQKVQFPLALALAFWAIGHLFAKGDLASLVLFGGMLLSALALFAMGIFNASAPPAEVRSGHDLLSIFAGIALFAAMAQLHPLISGVPIVTPIR
jgi:uncharacterized membrane protein